jgi:hypothetical protein
MVFGGLAGMLITRAHKPVYQSQAIITTAVDYTYTGHLQDFELDHLIMAVGDVIDSTSVRESVVESILSDDSSASADEIFNNMTLIRKGYKWLLTVRDSDPVTAQRIALLWANEALDSLTALRTAATDAFRFQVAQFTLEECLSRIVVVDPVSSGCSNDGWMNLGCSIKLNQPDTSLDYRN